MLVFNKFMLVDSIKLLLDNNSAKFMVLLIFMAIFIYALCSVHYSNRYTLYNLQLGLLKFFTFTHAKLSHPNT